ncbi:MAG: hypothetical protein M1821_001885 [Bathelium mastoideum]|nr:MAG: hypothetical protein M1821_001885 [Bathelium mastoideum]
MDHNLHFFQDGYECYGATGVQPYQTCISTVLAGQLSTIACDSNSAVPTSTSTFNVPQTLVATETSWWTIPYTSRGSYFTTTSPTDTTTSTLTLPYFSVFAPMIQMNWKAEDRPTVPTTTSTLLSPTLKPSLSTGSKAAIGVVVPLSILMVAMMFAFLVFRRQKQRRNRPAEFHKPELDANEKHNAHLVAPAELPATERHIEMSPDERHELSTSEQLNEISSEPQHELPASNTIHESDGPSPKLADINV